MRLKALSSRQQSASGNGTKHRGTSLLKSHRKPTARLSASPQERIQVRDKSPSVNVVEEMASPPSSPSVLLSVTPLDPNKERTITVKEAAFRLGKSDDAVYLWLRTGRLRGWQPGGRGCAILVSEPSVQEALYVERLEPGGVLIRTLFVRYCLHVNISFLRGLPIDRS